MMDNKTMHTAKVKMNGEDLKVNLTINWEGVTEEQMRELATRTVTIKWQNDTRNGDVVPDTDTEIDALDYVLGRPRTIDPMKALNKLSDEQLQELLKSRGLI